jgi:hypothetical protein
MGVGSMTTEEFRALLGAAHQAAVMCIVNARNLRQLILRSSAYPSGDTIACTVIAIERGIDEVRTTGRALGKAYRENIDGTLSGWVATSPIKEHEDVIDEALNLIHAISSGFPHPPKGKSSETKWYSQQVKKQYSRIRLRVKELTRLDGFRHQADLARVHDAALKEWMALLASLQPSAKFSERQCDALDAIYDLKAFTAEHRVTTDDVANKVGVDGPALKEPISSLVNLKMLDSKKGRGGGIWLTDNGKKHVESQRKR